MKFWLAKSEPSIYSIDRLRKDGTTRWDSIRNYQARNFLKEMEVGDSVIFYHSSGDPSGAAGIARVEKKAYPDPTQFDVRNDYYDPKSTKETPRWFSPDFGFVKKFPRFVSIGELRGVSALKNLELLKRGSRLSVHPLSEKEFKTIVKLAEE